MSLPFTPNIHALNHWLKDLNQFGSHRASSMLCEALQSLYKQPLDSETNLLLLNVLTVPVIAYADELESLLVKYQATENTLSRKTAALSCHLLRLLSINYDKLSLIHTLKTTQQLTVLYNGLHVIGLWQLKQTIFNQCPSKTTWKMNAEFFQRAQRHQLLDEINIETPLNNVAQRCITEILQRNILFELCDPYHFSPSVIKKLFTFADNYFALLNINASAQQAHFSWAYRQLNAPARYIKSASTSASRLYANCQAIADLLIAQNPLNLSQEDVQYLYQYLTGYKEIINSAIHTSSTRCKLVFDYFQIHEHLNHRAAINNILRVSSKTQNPLPRSNTFQLLPRDTPQSHKSLNVSSETPYNYSLHPTHTKNYFVTSVAIDLTLQCDAPMLFTESDINIKLGILKQVTAHPVNISQHILIEHLPGNVESVQTIIDEEAGLGILITRSAEEKEVLLPPTGKHQPGTTLIMIRQAQQESYCLTKLLHAKACYLHFKISPD